MKTKTHRKLHLNIKGRLNNIVFHPFALAKAKTLGLETAEVKHISEGNIELIIVGERTKLWDMVHWAKKGPFFSIVHEVVFQFSNVEELVDVLV